jgi:hypothetical protein
MINIETDKIVLNSDSDVESKNYFQEFAKESSVYLTENEFYSFLEKFLKEHNKGDLIQEFRTERLFDVYVEKGSTKMSYEEFSNAYKESLLLLEDHKDDFHVDFKFEESDFTF